MAAFEIKTKERLIVNREFVNKELGIQVSTISSNPFDEVEKIHNGFVRVNELDLKSTGYLNLGYLEYKQIKL